MADEDISDPTPLEIDFTCPICKNIFDDPVLLSCTHSFCKACLEQYWKSTSRKLCAVCRQDCSKEQPIPNRALKDAIETYKKDGGGLHRVPGVAKLVCGIHNREFQLFCEKDETPLCTECLNLHYGHNLFPLDQGIPFCKVIYINLFFVTCTYFSVTLSRISTWWLTWCHSRPTVRGSQV